MPSSDPDARLTYDELNARLDDIFYLDISSGRSYETLLDLLVLLPREKQEFALHWGKVAAGTDVQVGQLVMELAPEALKAMAPAQAEHWVVAALDNYDRKGIRAAVASLRDIGGFMRTRAAVSLESVEARLTRFVQGLGGRPLRVAADTVAWTDTATLHLPRWIDAPDAIERYKALAALLWGQTRYGTFDTASGAALSTVCEAPHAATWLALLEAVRVSCAVARDFPGLGEPLALLLDDLPQELDAARLALARADATVADSLAWLPQLVDQPLPTDAPLGALRPLVAAQLRNERITHDTLVLRRALAALKASATTPSTTPLKMSVAANRATLEAEVRIDGVVVALPPEGQAAALSLIQDLGAIPPECMTPAGPGEWAPIAGASGGPAATLETHADALYDEWDYRRRAYRRQWCHLYLRELPPGDADYVEEVRRRHRPLIRQIKRRFEALRSDDRILRRQADGPEIDLDALVEAVADRRGGAEPGQQLFCRRNRNERSLAAMFMVDMSGSTKGWVNDAEREALIMLCEALEMLGDRYAIWGFSGWTRTRCELYRIKDFATPYDESVRRRIAAIEARDYTRMGPPLRHLTRLLLDEPARHRLLVTLSDGRPDDFGDEYRSQYGIEDTRQALLEARQAGVRAYCVTIDRHGADYLKHMYGPARYTVLDDVRKLPLKIADIYRKLTT